MAFRCTPAVKNPVETLSHKPWEMAIKPFQVAPQTYYVAGQVWVGCYLIDTGEGLILIDSAIPESLYMLVNSIYELGYKPEDIKKILISHAHFDHCGGARAMKELTGGADIYMSHEDYEFMKSSYNETMIPQSGSHTQDFIPDKFYSEDTPIKLGNISVNTFLTPGHTPGCTSFTWKVKNPITGDEYVVGMHGGVGANTMNDDYYASSKCLTPDLRDRFIRDASKLKEMHIDIALPSHPNQIEILDRAGEYSDDNQIYLDRTIWSDFIDERVRQVKILMK